MQSIENTKNTVLEFKNLKKIFNYDLLKKSEIAVNNLSCRFIKGVCTGLLGHNGAGKTTSIKMVFGIIKPNLGKILYNGAPISIKHKYQIGYMPEVSKLPLSLRVEEVLTYHLMIYKSKFLSNKQLYSVVRQTLEQVDMWDARHKKIAALSKGMARRIAWLCATIHEPELVILDEPFSGLDPLGRYNMVNWIKDLKSKRISIILCTHELEMIEKLCDEYHILKKGSLVYSTVDKVVDAQGILKNELQTIYELQISGMTLDKLKELKMQDNLPMWVDFYQDRFLCKLKFIKYEDAIRWLSYAIDKGLIIVKFTDEYNIENQDLKTYFGEA